MEPMAKDNENAVAIIGMGCRFPQAAGIDAYWKLLTENIDAITPIPESRFDSAAHYAPEAGTPGKTSQRHGGFLDDAFGFDANFFGVSPVEARSMDPQQRVLLQVVWEALEDAGILPSALAGSRTGVFVGQATAEYAESSGSLAEHDLREATGSHLRAVTAGRVSYALDLRGPSLVLDTACSSSLVAVHAARQSLLTGESSLAIAGGVNIIVSPRDAIAYSQAAMLSSDGRCKFGDAGADGFVRSEGVGVVVLKRLADARRDGDQVLALLLGSAVTNDGRGSGFLIQPAVSGQVDMVREACRSAGIVPAQLDYVEAHGTGTPVGDGVELRALAEALAGDQALTRPLRIGSAKSNIGHAEAAAGIAGMIKAVLVARHGVVPASLHVREPHPVLADWRMPVEVVRRNEPLAKAGPAALVGVSSFGLSGTNAHVVLAEFVPDSSFDEVERPSNGDEPAETEAPQLLVLAARSDRSLRRLAAAYADHLGPNGAGRRHPLREICAAAALRRDPHPYRLWVIGSSHDELAAKLRLLADGAEIPDGGIGEAGFGPARQVVFVLPGQGSQWLGMGRGLLRSVPAFGAAMAACDEAVQAELGWSLIELLTRGAVEGAEAGDFPTSIDVVQPALWAMEISLAAVWRSFGVRPDAVVGHSMGEAAAAYLSGALSLRDSAAVICRRSRLMKRLAGRGAMLAVELSASEARRIAAPHGDAVCVAVENSASSTVLAGKPALLGRIAQELDGRGVFSRFVKVEVASHSPEMELLREDLLAELADLTPGATRTTMVSSVRADTVRGAELDAGYWMENLRGPVRFADSVQRLTKEAENIFVEISPHPVLVAALEANLAALGAPSAVLASARRRLDERAELTRSVGRLFGHGGTVDWSCWYPQGARNVPLPAYPWDMEQLRRTPRELTPASVEEAWNVTEFTLDPEIAGVSLRGVAPVPPAAFLSAVREAAEQLVGSSAFALEQVQLGQEMVDFMAGEARVAQVRIGPEAVDGSRSVVVETAAPAGADHLRTRCLSARLRRVADQTAEDGQTPSQAPSVATELDAAMARCGEFRSAADFHRLAQGRGYEIAEGFRAVTRLWRRDGEAVAHLRPSGTPQAAVLETGLQPLLAALPSGGPGDGTYIPLSFEYVRQFAPLTEEFWSRVTFRASRAADSARADVVLSGPEGQVLVELRGIRLRRLSGPRCSGATGVGGRLLRLARPVLPVLPAQAVEAVEAVRSGAASALCALGRRVAPVGRRLPIGQAVSVRPPVPASVPTVAPTPIIPAAGPTATPTPAVAAPAAAPVSASDGRILLRHAGVVLGMSEERIDPRRPLRDYGLDSLMATQLRSRLRAAYGVDVSLSRLLGTEGTGSLTDWLGTAMAAGSVSVTA
ncbi:acyl transferase domain-containing protein/aryl carrier-like protein [Kitasatospora sp. MAP12-15]|uniref:type I polyketide synthase n=1 Tax=unclassified Kitasatospora TaxID=2633591 RepID=UPI002474992F|nr:beta-ketoacyl synthase N-terminal-like domain-containing protein [Kitasatospora sp. MAP12-44]MDH6112527.1 acyl transferase domain-containing protein/aryl carrier-like protein [Kitasatospora sp. MAP12-44]